MRCWLGRTNSHIEVVGINDTSDPRTNAHLLRYDTMLGKFDAEISADDSTITVMARQSNAYPIGTLTTYLGKNGTST
jgi:glyceraldehyde-3-phosphate dehydrogenase/erythrose-4-phosphate dehydrogenase